MRIKSNSYLTIYRVFIAELGLILLWSFILMLGWPNAVALAQADFTNVSNTSGASRRPDVAVDGAGILHVVWEEGADHQEIYYARSDDGGATWSTAINISNTPGRYSVYPAIAVDGDNTLHVVWQDWSDPPDHTSTIYYAYSPAGGATWHRGPDVPNSAWPTLPDLATDDANTLHVVWLQTIMGPGGIFHTTKPEGSGWAGIALVADASLATGSEPALDLDRGGAPHVVWDYDSEIYYAHSVGGSWAPPVNISNTPGDSEHPTIAIDGADGLHVAWAEDAAAISYVRNEGAGWSPPASFAGTSANAQYPALAARARAVYLVWPDGAADHQNIYQTHKFGAEDWTTPSPVCPTPGGSTRPAVAMGHVVWEDVASGNEEIYYSSLPRGQLEVEVSIIAPTLTLNADGWYEPNPFSVTATVWNNSADTFENLKLGLRVDHHLNRLLIHDGIRLWYKPYHRFDSLAVQDVGSLDWFAEYDFPWDFWAQPAVTRTLVFTAEVTQWVWPAPEVLCSATLTITIPQAQVRPVVVVPGFMGSWRKFVPPKLVLDPLKGVYDDLLDELRVVGYEDEKSLFPFPYDWQQSNVDSAADLQDKVDDITAMELPDSPYIDNTQVDIVVHSMGNLVSRYYVQRLGGKDKTRRLISIAGPHQGSPKAYVLWAGGALEETIEGGERRPAQRRLHPERLTRVPAPDIELFSPHR